MASLADRGELSFPENIDSNGGNDNDGSRLIIITLNGAIQDVFCFLF